MAILVYIMLEKTTFGYELKACGLSRDAAQYAGINSKRNIVLSMVISGALSGIGGAIYYLAGTGQLQPHRHDFCVALYQLYPGRRCRHAARLLVRDH